MKMENGGSIVGLLGKIPVTLLLLLRTPFKDLAMRSYKYLFSSYPIIFINFSKVRSNATSKFLSLSNWKPKRKLAHDDSITIVKKQKRCPVRRKKVDINNCLFSSDVNDDKQDVTSVNDKCEVYRRNL